MSEEGHTLRILCSESVTQHFRYSIMHWFGKTFFSDPLSQLMSIRSKQLFESKVFNPFFGVMVTKEKAI